VRGCFDGDGTIYSYWDKRWKSSFMFYIAFASGSLAFLSWLKEKLNQHIHIKGHITKGTHDTFQLKYAKKESIELFEKMFYSSNVPCLKRKHDKALNIFKQNNEIAKNRLARVL